MDADNCFGRPQDLYSRGLTFELTPTAEAGRLARAVQDKPRRRTGKLACRSGSVLSEGLGSTHRFSA